MDRDPTDAVNTVSGVSDNLKTAVADARLLVDYASRHRITLERKDIRTVLKSAKAVAAGGMSPEAELAFIEAFREISKKVYPITVESIKTENRVLGTKGHVPFYIFLSILTLLCLIGTQIYWVAGVQVLGDLDGGLKEYDKIVSHIVEEEASLESGRITNEDIEHLHIQLRSIYSKMTTDGQSLHKWNAMWATLVPMSTPFETVEYGRLSLTAKTKIDAGSSRLVLQAMSSYILPMLYGLLGACIYILRSMSQEITAVTFTPQSAIRYGLRLTLGPLAGIAIGLLTSPDYSSNAAPPVLRSLAPLALAFVAGYGIELVFVLLDRIISSFTTSPGQREETPERSGRAPDSERTAS